MHQLIDLRQGERNGYGVAVWVCACGRKGSGSLSVIEAKAGFLKHARAGAKKAAGLARRQPRSVDW
jgi:hypothetical protein